MSCRSSHYYIPDLIRFLLSRILINHKTSCARRRSSVQAELISGSHRLLQGGMDITVCTGGVRLVLQDTLGQPLLELELGPMDAAAQRLAPGVLKARSPVQPSI